LISAGVHQLEPREWHLHLLTIELRREGYECRGSAAGVARSRNFPPNPEPYLFDCRLAQAARGHAVDMATRDALSHRGSDGSTQCDRAKRFGVDTCSECISQNRLGAHPISTRLQFQSSFTHCIATMNPPKSVNGVGASDNARWAYWVQMHGGDDNKPDTSCHPAPGEFPPVPPVTTRRPLVGNGLQTLAPGYTLPPGVSLPPGFTLPGAPAPPPTAPAPAPAPAPTPAPVTAPTPAPATAPAAGETATGDKGEKGGKGSDREAGFDANASLDLKDRAVTFQGPPAGLVLGVSVAALWS